MSGFLFFVAAGACLAVLAVLAIGIGGFGSGKASPQFSQRMMRLRIIAQAIALVFVLLAIWAAKSGN